MQQGCVVAETKSQQSCAHTRKCCRFMFQGYVAVTCPLVWTDAFLIVQHQFEDDFVPAPCPMKSLQHIPETCTCNIFMCVQMLWFCPSYMSRYMTLMHVASACTTHGPFCRCYMSLQHDHSCLPTFRDTWKSQVQHCSSNLPQTHCLCDGNAMLHQPSYEATHLGERACFSKVSKLYETFSQYSLCISRTKRIEVVKIHSYFSFCYSTLKTN